MRVFILICGLLVTATTAWAGADISTSTLVLQDAAPVNFGTQASGTGSTRTVTVRADTGSDLMQIEFELDVANEAAGDFDIVGGTCDRGGQRLADGETCTLQLAFAPRAPGERTGTVDVTCRTVTLVGGVAGGGASVVCGDTAAEQTFFGLVGQGLSEAVARAVPLLGPWGLSLLAGLLVAAASFSLRRSQS